MTKLLWKAFTTWWWASCYTCTTTAISSQVKIAFITCTWLHVAQEIKASWESVVVKRHMTYNEEVRGWIGSARLFELRFGVGRSCDKWERDRENERTIHKIVAPHHVWTLTLFGEWEERIIQRSSTINKFKMLIPRYCSYAKQNETFESKAPSKLIVLSQEIPLACTIHWD